MTKILMTVYGITAEQAAARLPAGPVSAAFKVGRRSSF